MYRLDGHGPAGPACPRGIADAQPAHPREGGHGGADGEGPMEVGQAADAAAGRGLHGDHHLDAGHDAHLGDQLLGGAHDPELLGGEFIGGGRGGRRRREPVPDPGEGQGEQDHGELGWAPSWVKMIIDAVSETAPATTESRSPTRTAA